MGDLLGEVVVMWMENGLLCGLVLDDILVLRSNSFVFDDCVVSGIVVFDKVFGGDFVLVW